jgi:SAM-dependent methyltransferase
VLETLLVDLSYFQHVRSEIRPLLPASAQRIVDVGSGAGHTARWVKSIYPQAKMTALEGFASVADQLRQNVDEMHILDLNRTIPEIESPDLVLFLDILEHLDQPDEVIRAVTRSMPVGGRIIISVPNIAHYSVTIPLFFKSEFRYTDSGILDRTHRHFFVRRSVLDLAERTGFKPVAGVRSGFFHRRGKWLDRLTLGQARDRLTLQYILAAEKVADRSMGAQVDWKLAKRQP